MANVDRPHGFRPLAAHASYSSSATNVYNVAAANTLLGRNDLVTLTAAGVIDRSAASDTQIVGATTDIIAAAAGGTANVVDDPHMKYEAQTDDGTGTLTATTDLNSNADIVVANATSGVSRMEIDENSRAVTATLPLKVLHLYNEANNEFGEFNRLVVTINNHVLGSLGVTGVV